MSTITTGSVTRASALAKALAEVQANLPTIPKSSTANVPTKSGGSYSFKYADLADVSAAVLPILARHGLSWLTMPTFVDDRFVLRYELLHTSGENRIGFYPLPDSSSKPQELGSAITYARRYALCSVVGVVPDEDDDGQLAAQAPRQERPPRQQSRPAAAKPAEVADLQKRAANAVAALLSADSTEKAASAHSRVLASPAKDVDVSGLLTEVDRETLGITAREVVTILQLADKVEQYVSKHGRAVRADAKAAA